MKGVKNTTLPLPRNLKKRKELKSWSSLTLQNSFSGKIRTECTKEFINFIVRQYLSKLCEFSLREARSFRNG